MTTKWLKRIVWILAIASGVLTCLYKLLSAAPGGEVIAWCIVFIFIWIAIGYLFAWRFGLRRLARKHLGTSLDYAIELTHPLMAENPDDVLQALHTLAETAGSQTFGLITSQWELLTQLKANHEPTSLTWRSRQINVGAWKSLPTNAAFFLELNNIRFIAMCLTGHESDENSYLHSGTKRAKFAPQLCLVSRSAEDNQTVRNAILARARAQSAIRGQTVLIRPGISSKEPIQVEFTSTSPVPKDRIILPAAIFEILDRATLRQFDVSATLQQAGLRTRTAVLLHGPPGTGKTLLTKYLVSCREELTTILLHGFRRGLVREAFRIARYCEPSIVVIEDVDLIAVARQKNVRNTSTLHELLDELDGLAPESKTIVIMTTNRPDVLEPALASRRGRVSQTIEVPLPDADCRRQILQLFTNSLETSQLSLDDWVIKTNGASPAFLEELVRRSILFAVDDQKQSRNSACIRITDTHIQSAICEILSSGGLLTQRLLGYASDGKPSGQQ